MIGNYCKQFRVSKNITLNELGGVDQIKNLSAFEHGRSSNVAHLERYIRLSIKLECSAQFLMGLGEVVKNGWCS